MGAASVWQLYSVLSALKKACRLTFCRGHCRLLLLPRFFLYAGWQRHSAYAKCAASNPPSFFAANRSKYQSSVCNTMKEIAVRTDGVFKGFGEGEARTEVLKDIRFEACMGELLMLVGPSGCGKTTLLSVIAGTLGVDCGNVEVFNRPLH